MDKSNKLENSTLSLSVENQGKFGYDVIKLVSGTTVSQLLLIIVAPFLTRLYGPEAFGIAALFTSITSIITAVSCLGYELSILLPESDRDAANLLALSLLISIVVSISTIPIIIFWGPGILYVFKAPELMPFLWLIPITIFFGGVGLGHPSLNLWNTRTKRFSRLSITQVINVFVTVSLQLVIGYLGYTSGTSLVGSAIIGSVTSVIMLSFLIWRDDGLLIRSSINWREMIVGFKRYRKFPLFESWAGLLNTLSWQLPTFLLASFFSPAVVGHYSMANRLLKAPVGLVANSVGRVFFQRAAHANIGGTLSSLVENVFTRLVKLGLFPMLLLSIVGKDLFIVVFGQEWAEAGIYTQILSIWVFFWFISTPLSNLFRVLEKQEFSLYINIGILMSRFMALWLGGISGNARLSLLLFSVSGILVYGYMSIVVITASGVSIRKVTRLIFLNFLQFIPFGLLLLVFKYTFQLTSFGMVGIACIFLVLYLIYVARNDPEIRFLVGKGTSRIQMMILRAKKSLQ
jgi:lipopolysaccharide exporter